MATWITHLRIANQFLQAFRTLDASSFAVGSIAPSIGIVEGNDLSFVPNWDMTHFRTRSETPELIADLDFYRTYLASLKARTLNIPIFSFRLGYFFHLISDTLWDRWVVQPTRLTYADRFAEDPNFINKVREDWLCQDFRYLRSEPKSIFWRIFLDIPVENGGLDFLPMEIVERQLELIQNYYQRDDDEIEQIIQRSGSYISEEQIEQFVNITVEKLLVIHRYFWIKANDSGDAPSCLDGFMPVEENIFL